MQENTLASVALLICSTIHASSGISMIRYEPHWDHSNDYKIHINCTKQWGVDTNMINWMDASKANESIRCAIQCEMEARGFIGDDKELLMDRLKENLMKDWGAAYSESGKKKTEYVFTECKNQYDTLENTEPCYKTYNFQKCLEEEQNNYYDREAVIRCIENWKGKRETVMPFQAIDSQTFYPISSENHCPSYDSSYCMQCMQRYVEKKGAVALSSLFSENGFLENTPNVKEELCNGIEKCYNSWTVDERSCVKDIAHYICLVSKFEQVTPFFIETAMSA